MSREIIQTDLFHQIQKHVPRTPGLLLKKAAAYSTQFHIIQAHLLKPTSAGVGFVRPSIHRTRSYSIQLQSHTSILHHLCNLHTENETILNQSAILVSVKGNLLLYHVEVPHILFFPDRLREQGAPPPVPPRCPQRPGRECDARSRCFETDPTRTSRGMAQAQGKFYCFFCRHSKNNGLFWVPNGFALCCSFSWT